MYINFLNTKNWSKITYKKIIIYAIKLIFYVKFKVY